MSSLRFSFIFLRTPIFFSYFTAKVIDASNEQEEKARSYFNSVPDQTNVTLDEFKGVVNNVAGEYQKTFDGLVKQLTDAGPKAIQQIVADTISTVSGATRFH